MCFLFSLDTIYSTSSTVPTLSIPDSTSTLNILAIDSTSSLVYHASYFHDQHFGPEVDSDSDLKGDVATSPLPVQSTSP